MMMFFTVVKGPRVIPYSISVTLFQSLYFDHFLSASHHNPFIFFLIPYCRPLVGMALCRRDGSREELAGSDDSGSGAFRDRY